MSRIHGKQKCVRGTMSLLSRVGDFDEGRTRFLSSFRRKRERDEEDFYLRLLFMRNRAHLRHL